MNLWPFAKQPSLITPWVVTASGIERLANQQLPAQLDVPSLIVPRKHLLYQCIDLTSVPRALRANLVQQRLKLFSPFNHPACWLVNHGDLAQVWFWDADRINGYCQQQAETLPLLDVVPEIALYLPCDNGLRIQACIDGFELQFWQQQVLRHSRWFASCPSERDKRDFVRICGAAEQDLWLESSADLLSKPWNEKAFWSKENLSSEAVAPRLVLGVLLIWLVLQLGLSIGAQMKESYLASRVANKTQRLKSIVQQRNGALQQQEFNQAINRLIDSPSQLHLLAQVRNCLAPFNFMILDWQYQRDQLTLLLQQDNLDNRALIEACSGNSTFIDVHAEPGIIQTQIRLLFTLPTPKADTGNDNA